MNKNKINKVTYGEVMSLEENKSQTSFIYRGQYVDPNDNNAFQSKKEVDEYLNGALDKLGTM